MATIYDVARIAGVSPKTVSRVLNGDAPVGKATREAVMKEEPSLSRETIDNIQDAIQERMRKLAQEKLKERKAAATPAPKVDEKTDVK
jgi:hypothetical protein